MEMPAFFPASAFASIETVQQAFDFLNTRY
jgi:hypothetical protein